MRHKFTILFLIFSTSFSLFSDDQFLYLSKESISVSYLSESEYFNSIYYSESQEFSTGLIVISEIDDVNIYFNNKKYDSDYLKINDLSSGDYYIKVKKNGYNSISKNIEIREGYKTILKVSLAREFGYIDIETNSELTSLYLNGYKVEGNEKIPTGTYLLKVVGFGYEDYKSYITVYDGIITKESIILAEAEFRVESIFSDKNIFNPTANEGFSSIKLNIKVNGPSKAVLKIINSYGVVLISEDIDFKTWNYSYLLDGKLYKDQLTNGIYSFILEYDGENKSADFEVDNTLILKSIPVSFGFSGLVYAATAELNRIKLSQTSLNLESSLNNGTINLPIFFSHTFNKNIQINSGIDTNVDFNNQNYDSNIYFGIKGVFNPLPFYFTAANILYRFKAAEQTEHRIVFNLPQTIKIGNLYYTITPGFNYVFNNDYYFYTSAGVHYDNQLYRFGVSAQSDFISSDFNLDYGVEFHRLINNSQTYFDVNIKGDLDINLSVGLGLSVIY